MATASDEYIFYYQADYIAEGYYEQELYFEGDYLEPGYYEGEQVVVEAVAVLDIAANLQVQTTVFVPAQADLAAEATQTTLETRIKQLDADFDALFSPNVTVSIRKNAFAILDAVASTETAATLIADIDKTLESIVNLDLQAAKFTGIETDFQADFAVSALKNRVRTTDIPEFSSNFAQTTQSIRTRNTQSNQVATAEFEISAVRLRQTQSQQTVTAQTTAEPSITRSLVSQISADAALSADSVRIQQGTIDSLAIFSPDVTAQAIIRPDVFLETAVSFATDAIVLVRYQSNLSAASNFVLGGSRTRSISADLSVSAGTLVIGDEKPGFLADIQISAALAAQTRKLQHRDWQAFRSILTFDYNDSDDHNAYYDVRAQSTNGLQGGILLDAAVVDLFFKDNNAGFLRQFSGFGPRSLTVSRQPGELAPTDFDNNDWVIDFYVSPVGDGERDENFKYAGLSPYTVIRLPGSDSNFRLLYRYYYNDDNNPAQRIEWQILENGVVTETLNTFPRSDLRQQSYQQAEVASQGGWYFFRLQKVNGILTAKYQDITGYPNGTIDNIDTWFSKSDSVDYGRTYKLFDSDIENHFGAIHIDNISVQIGTPDIPVDTSLVSVFPDRPDFYVYTRPFPAYLGFADLVSTASLAVTNIQTLQNAEAELSTQFSITANTDKIVGYSANINSDFNAGILGNKTAFGTAELENITEISTDVNFTARGTAEASSFFITTIENTRARIQSSTQTSSFTSSITAAKTVGIFDTFGSQYILTLEKNRLRDNQVDTDSVATQLAIVVKTGRGLITLESTLSLNTAPVIQTNTSVLAESQADVALTPSVIRTVPANILAATALSADPFNIKQAASLINSEFTQTVISETVSLFDIDLETAFTAEINPFRFRDNTILLNTTATILSDNVRVRIQAAEFGQSDFVLFATYASLFRPVLVFESIATDLVIGRVIHIDDFRTLIVPQETRLLLVPYEDRTIQVTEETRKLTVWQQ